MTARRGTSNTNARGSAESRRRRKAWLLAEFGDGLTAPCWECGTPVTAETCIADRIIPGADGGTYRRGNIRCHCAACSERQGGRMGPQRRAARAFALATDAAPELARTPGMGVKSLS